MEVLNRINEANDIKKLSLIELQKLSEEISDFLLANISKTGGHLASNLGVIDLTISLLKVFDFTKDKIIFDVGHQTYTYKILTGRKQQFASLRKYNGLSWFPKRSESIYDFFDTGHSSNSISSALGFARARDLMKEVYNVIALIGDGAMTGGEAYEGMNDLGSSATNMLVILNDNGESISSSVGGLSKTLNKIRINPSYLNFKKDIKGITKKSSTIFVLKKIKNRLKNILLPNHIFENFGLKYFGPIDGHNIKELVNTLNQLKNIKGPVLLHVITKKGKGYLPAMMFPNIYHGVSKFDVEKIIENKSPDYSAYFGQYLLEEAKNNEKIVAITAAMKDGTGLTEFANKYPERFFDVGIAEGHAVSVASGLALSGFKPFVAIYSTFIERAYDQILIDVCMQDLPVVFAIDRAGLVGSDGETHQGIFDISFLSHMPNLEIIAPKCEEELKGIIKYAVKSNHPVAIRYPRGNTTLKMKPLKAIKKGKWETLRKGQKVVLIATGRMVEIAYQVGLIIPEIEVINATFIKPLDEALLSTLTDYQIITLEDNQIVGGLGHNVLLYLNSINYQKKVHIIGFKNTFIKQGNIDELLKENKMDLKNIVKLVKGYLKI